MIRAIDNIEELTDDELTLENLRPSFETGRSTQLGKDPRTRRIISKYRNGRLTPIGDIEESVWRQAVLRVVDKRKEQKLFEALLTYYRNDPSPALKNDFMYWAFSSYARETYNNPKWVGYEDFHKNYYIT